MKQCSNCSRRAEFNRTRCRKCLKILSDSRKRINRKLRKKGICTYSGCGKKSLDSSLCSYHRAYYRKLYKKRTAKYIKSGMCVRGCGRRSVKRRQLCSMCSESMKKYWQQRKHIVLTHYGKNGKLLCCWEGCIVNDLDMLSLDHINNDGRKNGQRDHNGMLYQSLIKRNFPSGFQTLCANHQIKKQITLLKDRRQ